MRWKGGKMRIQNVMATSIKIDTVSATQSLRSMNTALKASTNAWKAEEVQAKSVGNYLKASQARYEGLGRSIDQAKEKIKLIQERQKTLDLTTEDGRNSYNRYAKQLGITVKQLSSMIAQQERAKSAMQYQTSGLASLQSRYRSLNEVNSSYVKRLEAEGKKYEAAKTRLTSYKSAVENLTRQQKIQESELSRIASESGKASSAYHAQEVKVNQTATSISKLNSKVKSAQSEVNKLNPNGFNKIANGAKHVTNAADKMKSSLKNAWEHVKSGATAAAAGIGAVGAAAISGAKKAGNLEQSYKEITNLAVTGGEKQKEAIKNVSEMQRQGRAMSIQYGKSQQDIADSYEELVKRGYSTKQALGAMRTELQASVASGDDFKDVVAVSSTTLESFGMRAKTTAQMTYNTKRAVNELAYAADMTSTGFKDLGYGMSYVGSSAHQAGFGLSQTAAAMGILSNNGLEASKAGTGLNEVINRLSTATGNLLKGDKKNALAKLGIKPKEITTSTGKLKDLSTVFGVLNKHMQGMSKVQKINIMKSLFGMTGEQAGLILTKYNKQLGTLSKQTLKAGKDGDYVAKLAKKNSETAKMQMARLKMTGEAFSMTLGAKMLPAINKAGDSLVIFLTKTKDGKKLTQDFANGVGAVANGLVNLIKWATTHKTEVKWIFGGLLTGYSVVKGAQFLQFLNKTRLAMTELGVLDKSKTAIKGIGSAFKFTGKLAKAGGKGILKAGKAFGKSFVQSIKGAGDAVKSVGSLIGKGAKRVGSDIADSGKFLGKQLVKGFKGSVKLGKSIGSSLVNGTKNLVSKSISLGKRIGSAISKGAKSTLNFSKSLFGKGNSAGKLTGLLQSAHSAGGFKNLTTAGKIGTSTAGVGVAVDTATSIVKAIKDKAGSRKQYEDVGTAAGKGIGGAIGLWFGGPAGAAVGASIGAKVGKWGGDAVKSFTNGWKSKKPPKRFWSLENLGWSTKDTFTKIGKWGQGVGKKFGQGLAKGKSFAKKNAKELALTAVSPLLGIPALLYKNNPKFRKWAEGVGKNIKKELGSAKKNVSNFNKSVAKNVGNFTKSAGKKYRQFTSSVSKTFKKHWNQMYKHSSKGTKQIMRSTEKFGKNYVKINKKYGDETRKNFGSFSKRLKKNHGDLFKTIGQTTKTQLNIEKKRWTANWKNIKSFAGGVWKGLTKNAGDMYKSLNAKTHGGLGKVFNGFKSFGKSVGDFWKNLWKGVKDTFDNAIKGLKDTASNVGKFFSGKLKVGNIHLAEGTDWKKKYGYPAIVNDGSDSPETNNREGIFDKTTGELSVVNGRNVPVVLDQRHEVFNASEMRNLGVTRHFASGTGWLKKLYEEAKKFWKQPIKTGDSNFDKITGLTGAINNLAKSAKKIGQAQGVKWWSQLWKMVENKVNDDDLGPAKGLLKAVEKLGEGKPYIWGGYGVHAKGFDCSGLVSTALEEYFHSGWGHLDVAGLWSHAHEIPKSKAKPGDPVFWLPDGHVGVYAGHNKYYSAFGPDIGMHSIFGQDPGTRGPVFGRFKGINTEGSKTSDDDVKVKTNNKLQKQIRSQVGKGFWSTIQKISDKYGEHDDGLQAGKPSGDHTHWLKQAHVPKRYWSAMNFIFTHESSWNPKAYNPQPTPTGHAHGIGQLTDGQMHYVKRHGSVNNAIAQIMGAYDYMNDRYGNPDKAEAFWKAHSWYANGGIVSGPQLAVVGEGNGPETIVPWDITKRARAYRLMDRTLKHFKQQDDPTDQSGDSKILLEILKVMTSIEKKLDAEINETRRLGEQPINVSGDFNIDGRKFARYLRTYLREFDRQTVVRGRYNLSDR